MSQRDRTSEEAEHAVATLFARTRDEAGRATLARLEARAASIASGEHSKGAAGWWRWALGGAVLAGGAAAAVALATSSAPDEAGPVAVPVAGGERPDPRGTPDDPMRPTTPTTPDPTAQPWALDDSALAFEAGWDEEDELGLDPVPDLDSEDPEDLDAMQAGYEAVLGS